MIRLTCFNIEKFYVDCIDNQGNCFIIYWAGVNFGLIRFVYSGLIFCDAKGNLIERSALRKTIKPSTDGDIQFLNKILMIEVSLKKSEDAIVRSLYNESESKELIWNCHHPKGNAEILFDGNTYKGFGYSETLFSQIKPWNLSIDELRWGRFLSDSCTIIWISWKGKYPINKIFFNGIEYNDAIFNGDFITFDKGIYFLKFSVIQIVRKGKLSALFSKMPLLKLFINRRILNTIEIKYKAKSTLSKNSALLSTGWSLFEIVTWGN